MLDKVKKGGQGDSIQ